MRFQFKLIVLIGGLLLFVITILGYSFQYMAAQTLKQQIGVRALNVAETTAAIPEIREAFAQPKPWTVIQPLAEQIRKQTDAEFVVVGNRQGIRYSHPNPAKVGQNLGIDSDTLKVLQGHTSISEEIGSLGPSLHGRAPIFNRQGAVIGLVSVGVSIEDIDSTIASYRNKIIALGVAALLLGVVGTLMIARSVKRAILGLEPEEIGRLYQEKQAVMESVREGLVAIDARGVITTVNQTALHMMHVEGSEPFVGKRLPDLWPESPLLDVVQSGRAEFDREMLLAERVLIVNSLPIHGKNGQVIGAVASLRNRSELYRLAEELSNVREYAEALRAQTHEYNNKLYTISGLLQLESYQEAIEFITNEASYHQDLIRFLMKEIPDPMIGGLLIGKINRAAELRIDLEIDRESSFRDVPARIDRDALIRIMGNLVDNAMEAVLPLDAPSKKVKLFLTDLGDDLIFEVEDRGVGLSEEAMERMFEKGFSTKAEHNHGYGLALVKQSLDQLQGYVTFERHPQGGTIFTVAIPKQPERKEGTGHDSSADHRG